MNPADGSLSVRINIPLPPGRLMNLPFGIAYDSNAAWFLHVIDSPTQSPKPFGIMSAVAASNSGVFTWGGWSASWPQLSRSGQQEATEYHTTDGTTYCYATTAYIFTDPNGNRHSLSLQNNYNKPAQACLPPTPGYSDILYAGDDRYQAQLVGASSNAHGSALLDGDPKIVDADGTVFDFGNDWGCSSANPTTSAIPASVEDRNGNKISITPASGCGTGFSVTDSIGRALLTVANYIPANNGAQTGTISVSGISQDYTITWATITPTGLAISSQQVGTDNNCPLLPTKAAALPPPPTTGSTVSVVTAITLPDGEKYSFGYDSATGFINKITYPTGGWVSYVWGTNQHAAGIGYNDRSGATGLCDFLYDTPAITQRSVSFDGSTVALTQTFSYPETTWNTSMAFNYQWSTKTTNVMAQDNVTGKTSKISYQYNPLQVPGNGGLSGASEFINQAAVEGTITYYGYSPSYPVLRTVQKGDQPEFLYHGE